MILIVNTCLKNSFEVIIADKKNDYKVKKVSGGFNCSEKLLTTIDSLLKKVKSDSSELKAVAVVIGPGGFTSVRIGVAIVNALGYGLNLPIIGLKVADFSDNNELVKKVFLELKNSKKGKLVLPYYDRKPNITIAKK
jgi:tRNA threonylcarbamoyl adenosine modification protein YeaZ